MILGMTLFQFKVLHTVLSLISILSGLNVMSRMVRMRPLGASNTIFLWTTILASVTGFFWPNAQSAATKASAMRGSFRIV